MVLKSMVIHLQNISRVQVIQNKLLKLILTWDWQTSTNFVHSDLKILKVEDIYKYNILNFVIRTLHDCPSQMNENLLISNSKLTSDSELIW